jgi:glycosyltransferase involved in cell wall biosynthesis
MACGVPVVASRVGGVPEVIEDGKSGYLHPPGALDAMAESAITLLSDAALHKTMSEAARRRVTDAFCADKIVPLYEAAYGRLL